MMKQVCIRFEHPHGSRCSSQWRQGLLPEHGTLLEDVAVYQSSTALSFTAKSPEASERLRVDALPLMRAVAALAGQMLSVESLDLVPSVAFTGYRWQYQIPRFVVARSGEDWAPWQEAALDAPHLSRIRDRINSDIQNQLANWGQSIHDLGIELLSAGTPMVLKNAVVAGPKPTSVMARKGMVISSTARIEGAFWTGLLQATGHGRVYRDGYQEKV